VELASYAELAVRLVNTEEPARGKDGLTTVGAVLPMGAASSSKSSRGCERCGAACRTERPVYGWVCARCARELDVYYVTLIGMSGGDPVQLYLRDCRAGKVPPRS
jgi:hypothetical protein